MLRGFLFFEIFFAFENKNKLYNEIYKICLSIRSNVIFIENKGLG